MISTTCQARQNEPATQEYYGSGDFVTDSYNLYRLMGAVRRLSDRLGNVFLDDDTDMAAADVRLLIEEIEQQQREPVGTQCDDGPDLPF